MCICDLAMQFYENTFMLYKVFTQTNQGSDFFHFKTLSDTFFVLEFT